MTIVHSNSVAILGAGVSEPFGMPLGGQLIDLIANQIEAETKEACSPDLAGRPGFDPHTVVDWCTPERWYRHPMYGTAIRTAMSGGSLQHEDGIRVHKQLQDLLRLLKNQTAETIDAFIAENPKSGALAKLMLAAMMLRSSYDPPKAGSGGPLKARPFSARVLTCEHRPRINGLAPTERNWIHLLINLIRHAIDEHRVSSGNKIKLITFNYDTVLERVLIDQFSNREEPLGSYTDYIEIQHVHGQVGTIEDSCQDPGLVAAEWAKGICVVKDTQPCEEIANARRRARELISAAQTIYAIGFAFAGPNCRLLGLDKQPRNHLRTIKYCNYDGNRGIEEAVKKYTQHPDPVAGDWSRPLSVTDYIKAGHLGEPPS